jgi:ABC-type siderophore export system fused ATPase/permease subunit
MPLAAISGQTLEGGVPCPHFDKIEMRDILFRYVDKLSEAGDTVGRSTSLRKGDLVFITGGSGLEIQPQGAGRLYAPDWYHHARWNGNDRTRDDYRPDFGDFR